VPTPPTPRIRGPVRLAVRVIDGGPDAGGPPDKSADTASGTKIGLTVAGEIDPATVLLALRGRVLAPRKPVPLPLFLSVLRPLIRVEAASEFSR
jgi:hypothetical protein